MDGTQVPGAQVGGEHLDPGGDAGSLHDAEGDVLIEDEAAVDEVEPAATATAEEDEAEREAEEVGAGLDRPSVGRHRPRPAPQRVRDLPSPWRWVAVIAIVLAFATPMLQGARALADGWRPVGDVALIGMRANDVITSPPTLGQPNSAQSTEDSGRRSSHLGPIESYLLAPGILALGPVLGLALGAAALNGVAWALTLWLAHRRGGIVLLALFAAAMPLMVRSLDPSMLHDPINSDISTLAMVALALAAWSLLEGDIRIAPLFVGLSAFVLQPQLANAGVGAVLTLVGAIGVVLTLRHPEAGDARWFVGAATVLVLVWLPPVFHELGSNPSNVGAVWATLLEDRVKVGVSYALGRSAHAVGPWPAPLFTRAWEVIPPTGRVGDGHRATGLFTLGVVGALAMRCWFLGRRKLARLLVITLGTAVAGVVTATSMPWVSTLRPDLARWMWVLGLLVWVAIAWVLWSSLSADRRRKLGTPIVAVLLLAAVLLSALDLSAPPRRSNGGAWAMPRVEALAASIRRQLPAGHYRIEPQGPTAGITVVPGLVLDLEQDDYRFYIPSTAFTRGYNARHFDHGEDVRGTIAVFAVGEGTPPFGASRLARVEPPQGWDGEGKVPIEAWLLAESPS